MKACAFLSMDDLDGYVSDDDLARESLAALGWSVDLVSWRDPEVDWDRFDAVIIRTPWDYQDDPDAFLSVLETIDRSSARLENGLDVVRWNLHKGYLRELGAQGIRIVPTLWKHDFRKEQFEGLFRELDADEIVLKPLISANAYNTFRLRPDAGADGLDEVETVFREREYMAQPFMRAIVTEGEFSLFFFGGMYSHAILKTPKVHDFRVQEEHGGLIQAVEAESALQETGHRTMEAVTPTPLYARADYVRTEDGAFALMELELIEPALYFRMDPGSAERFARIFDVWMGDPPVASTRRP